MRATVLAALVAAVVAVGAGVAPHAQAAPAGLAPSLPLLDAPTRPDQDAFYRVPSDLDGHRPGDVLRYRESRVYLDPARLVPAPVRAWQVLYRSTGARDEANAVSGTVLVPETPWRGDGPRPIVSYTIGTHGLGDQCAPSYLLASGRENEFGLMSQALAKGWALAVTDYEGLGSSGNHTYAVQIAEGRAALDAARAAIRLDPAGLADGSPVALWGYSQGGGAAASAGEQAHRYAEELHTVGAADGGVPADLLEVAKNLDGGIAFGLLAGAAAGYDTAYPDIGIRDLLNAKGKRLIDQVRGECTAEMTARHPGHRLNEFTTIDRPLEHPPLVEALRENRIGGVAPDMPVLIYHAQADELIPLAVARKLFAEYCEKDVTTRYLEIPAAEHIGGAILGGGPAVAWLADRFAGKPAPNSCD